MNFQKILFSVAAMSFVIVGYAQMEAKDKVEVKLNKYDIGNAVYHFDIPFNITGIAPSGCKKIRFYYKVSDDERIKKDGVSKFRRWISLPDKKPSGTYVLSGEWKSGGSDQNFSLHCRGMHPNVKYDFRFEIIKDPTADDKVRTTIKKKLSDVILSFYENAVLNGFHNLTGLNTDIENILKRELKIDCDTSQLREKCHDENTYHVDVTSDPIIKKAIENLTGIFNRKFNATDALTGGTNSVSHLAKAFEMYRRLLPDTIEILLSDKTALTKFSRAILDQPFSPSIEAFKTYTLKDGLLLLRKMAYVPEHLVAIFKGHEKIFNKEFAASDKLDIQSIQFLHRLFNYLSESILQYTEDNRLINIFNVDPTPGVQGIYEQLLVRFDTAYRYTQALNDAEQKLEAAKLAFPDLVAEIVQSESLTADVISVADVTSSKTPYISADGGIGYSTSFQTAFSYFGANFYLSPINKKAKLGTFKGWNLVKKMICLNLAISNFFGTRPVDSYSILGSDNADLLVGLGLRTGRVIKFNFDWLPYKTNNTNPLGAKKDIKFDFIISVGADVNLLSAFNSVAKALKLIQ